jgi:hypothetical protein
VSTILKAKIALVDEDAQEKLKSNLGREPREGELEQSLADFYVDLLEVKAIRQSYDLDGKLEEEHCTIYFNGKMMTIIYPYDEAVALWLEAHGDDTIEVNDVGHAVKTLAKALAEDKSERSLYYAYQSNIAMAFKDHFAQHSDVKAQNIVISKLSSEALHEIANDAAKYFLNQLIKSVE